MNPSPITQATLDDAPALRELQTEAREWLAARGSDQWSKLQHSDPDSPRSLEASIRRGEVYVIRDGASIIGTLTLDDYADPEFWTAADDPEDALYIHRMIVRRQAAGADLGGRMLDWATAEASRQGRQWLRLDAWRANLALQDYYRRQGFAHVRTVNRDHRGSGALFQRRAATLGKRTQHELG